jgi:hypothetical protein
MEGYTMLINGKYYDEETLEPINPEKDIVALLNEQLAELVDLMDEESF